MKNTKSGRKELVNIGGIEVLIVVAAISLPYLKKQFAIWQRSRQKEETVC